VRKELALSAFWFGLSAYLALESHRLGLSAGNRPGPGFFPFGAAAGIGVLALFRLVQNFRQPSPRQGSANGEAHLVLAVIGGMAAYVLLFDFLGFLLCTFLLVVFYLKAIAARAWGVSAAFAAVVALASHVFFNVLLNAHLPRGLLGWFN
jgi:putative tricarboxylic transport membrane protein